MPWPRSAHAVKAVFNPILIVKALLRRFPLGSFEFRLALEAFPRPWYAFGLYHAADLARRLGQTSMSAIEFGVAGGDGLVELERIAVEVEKTVGIRIHCFGFDTGKGLPQESDYRDLPYTWRKGMYEMDQAAVRSRLSRAELVLGDVRSTIPQTLEHGLPGPIGFISFDLDYYTSTTSAFHIFDGPDALYLPRVVCYFDDINSGNQVYHCEDVGELLAIREFNANGTRHHKIRPAYSLASDMPLSPTWAEQIWIYHRFDHAQYNTYIR
jgi:hypothetical protein